MPARTGRGRPLALLPAERGRQPIVLDFYGNDSRPVAHAQEQVETLRRIKTIGDFGILRGSVVRGGYLERKAVPNARVVARRASDNMQFVATTIATGAMSSRRCLPASTNSQLIPSDHFSRTRRGQCNSRILLHVTLSRSPTPSLVGTCGVPMDHRCRELMS